MPIIIGIQITKVTHIGASTTIEKPSAIGTMKILTMKITKTVGPSPASSIVKSASQDSQLSWNVRNPLKSAPSPHFGHRPFRPVSIAGSRVSAIRAANNHLSQTRHKRTRTRRAKQRQQSANTKPQLQIRNASQV